MDVTGIATPITPDPNAEAKESRLGKDEFLKLLMAQLGNQDPLSPMDNQAFVTQLAQFAQVEMAQTASQQLDALLMASASANQLQAASLVGKVAVFRNEGLDWSGPPVDGAEVRPVEFSGEVGAGAKSVVATIRDAQGNTVRTIPLGEQHGTFSASWDGRTDKGEFAPAGSYTVTIVAQDASGDTVPAESFTRARITGVSFESGVAELVLSNDRKVKLADVPRVAESV